MNRTFQILIVLAIISLSTYSQTWLKVSCGGDFSVGLRSDSTLWSWGYNYNGQLGHGDTLRQSSPMQIGTDHNWADIATGAFHCLALKSDGSLWSWGSNNDGQLGINSLTGLYEPIRIGTGNNWKNITCGSNFSFAIQKDSSLWSWGWNGNGELDDSTTVNKLIPTHVGLNSKWLKVAGGGEHSLALKSDGTIWATGQDAGGQLGNGSFSGIDSIFTQVESDTDWIAISAGFAYCMALKSNHTIWSWGFNGNGQLGFGNTFNEDFPLQIGTDSDWVKIAAGSCHAFAIKADSTLYGWGYNGYGQLGDGSTTQQNSPELIGTDHSWIDVSPARGYLQNNVVPGTHTCGIKTPTNVICATGNNWAGQLGDGMTVNEDQFSCNTNVGSGIVEIEKSYGITVYPNPATTVLNIHTQLSIVNCQLTITDLLGTEVYKEMLTGIDNTITISTWNAGLYFYEVRSNSSSIRGKFVKEL